MTNKIDPSTLSGTELLLRLKYAQDTLATSSPEALQGAALDGALPVYKDVIKASQNETGSDAEMLLLQERARKLVEAVKQAQKNKGTQ
ncbi:hypothetical protein [Pseudomonas atacamensis]|uniref:hypothetical protein n=1 Tax=Pseudomonas atacamensis TaxID=2565368 RepID=UPI00247FAFCE|nr:hypothetical protein [Pseudomonas atacamensis]WGT32985.1 hypothetical protein QG303_21845 [Pseudomonas atacamensis]